jgi:NAD(P)-dependent dehydrogenase (short-subunit alcohol dehydrogenase family)
VRKPADGEALAAAHARIQPIRLDVCDAASVAAAAAQIDGEVGNAGLDGLVNNAGIALIAPLVRPRFVDLMTAAMQLQGAACVSSHLNPEGGSRCALAPQELMPAEEFARVFDVNVTGPLRVTQQFLPLLRTAKGRIVNMGSQVRLAAAVSIECCMQCAERRMRWAGRVRDSRERSRIQASARTAAPSSR